jgi:uncharacterized membrane protein
VTGKRGAPLRDKIKRIWRHRLASTSQVRSTFTSAAFERIESAIAEGERLHRGEVQFAVEAELDLYSLWADMTARERGLRIFSEQAIWDTEENTGVLIYLLWADHAVEIIADRAAHRCLPAARWQEVCTTVTEACRAGRHVDGVVAAIQAVNQALHEALPIGEHDDDELPNRPIVL